MSTFLCPITLYLQTIQADQKKTNARVTIDEVCSGRIALRFFSKVVDS